MNMIKISNFTFTYPKAETPAVSNINLEIGQGEFAVFCGVSGSGKTTLMRNLKPAIAPYGEKSGSIFFQQPGPKSSTRIEDLSDRELASKIGYVMQNPDNQIVTDKVWHELAFALENLGYDRETIRIRVAEMASYFGIHTWINKSTSELSGGQKQLLNLAAVMILQPELLILDEPTAQLDPASATEFLHTIEKINKELGTTIILSEHRLDEVLPLADKAIVLEKGKIIADDIPENVAAILAKNKNKMFIAMPAPIQLYGELYNLEIGCGMNCPVDIPSGRKYLSKLLSDSKALINQGNCKYINKEEYADVTAKKNNLPVVNQKIKKNELAIYAKDIYFRYEKNGEDIVKAFDLQVKKGETFAILGGNGSGKSTALNIIAGLLKAYRGRVEIYGEKTHSNKINSKIGLLPQNPQSIFIAETVFEELKEILPKEEKLEIIATFDLENILHQHPYDISGGEQQRLALAKIFMNKPKILLLDEPTKGMDNAFKEEFALLLSKLKNDGVTILMVSHDIEFCAKHTDSCSMFFDGSISTIDEPRKFFSGNNFYTTAINKMSRQIYPEAIIVKDLVEKVVNNNN
ncbi:MAG: ABC transporter ATP-binding protein [Anaerovoracaceae bacterium]